MTSPHGTYERRRRRSFDPLSRLAGVETALLTERDEDRSTDGFNHWPLMSVHNWGENPVGVWKIRITDAVGRSLRHYRICA